MIVNMIKQIFRIKQAYAHCDIPCGIYDPVSAKIAAQTVLKMVMRIEALDHSSENTASQNSFARYVTVKEKHADLVKHEIDILWHDYFKPEHLESHPDLHTNIWEATKLASANKQGVDLDLAKDLVKAVDNIASIFWATKGVDYSDPNEAVRFGT